MLPQTVFVQTAVGLPKKFVVQVPATGVALEEAAGKVTVPDQRGYGAQALAAYKIMMSKCEKTK